MKEVLNVSTSGGRSSMFMARLIQTGESFQREYEPLYLFCNTGKERSETLDFLKEAQERWSIPIVWLEAVVHSDKGAATTHRVVSYESASRRGEPFDAVIEKYGVPNRSYRHCTRELKQHVMASYLKSLGYKSWTSAIGFRFDEPHRMSGQTKWGPAIYPLYDLCMRRQAIRLWWNEQPFDLGIEDYQGNCDLCFAKNLSKKVKIAQENPELLKWWQDKEKQSDRPFDIRECVSMEELEQMAKGSLEMPSHEQQEFSCMCEL